MLSTLESYDDENIIFDQDTVADDLVSDQVDQDLILEDEEEGLQNLVVLSSEDLNLLLASDQEAVVVDYSEQLTHIENNLQVLNATCILLAVVVFVSGFIKIFNKFFCFDMI